MWPQWTFIFLMILGYGFVIAKHGTERKPYNIWEYLFNTALTVTLLYFGGFFKGLF